MQLERSPHLDGFESTVSIGGRAEALRPEEFRLLEMLIRYADETLSREELKRCFDADSVSDRRLDLAMRRVMQKMAALWPAWALVRFVPVDGYVYSETAPKRKAGEVVEG